MKELIITREELLDHSFDYQEYITQKLDEKGFDLNKPVFRVEKDYDLSISYYQEE